MATLTIKNIPQTLYERLKAQAARHRRSLNLEAIACLEQVTQSVPLDPDRILARARTLRQHTADAWLTDDTLTRLKTAGRP